LLLGAVDYLALGDEAGFGGLPRGLPGRGVTEGEDGALGAGGGGGRAEEWERRVEAGHGGLRGVVLRVAGGPASDPKGGGVSP
jgi:hypothetical protein